MGSMTKVPGLAVENLHWKTKWQAYAIPEKTKDGQPLRSDRARLPTSPTTLLSPRGAASNRSTVEVGRSQTAFARGRASPNKALSFVNPA